MLISDLEKVVQWDIRYEPWYGSLGPFLLNNLNEVDVDVFMTRVRIKASQKGNLKALLTPDTGLIDSDASTLISTIYLKHLRQQLSRSARNENRSR